MENRAVFLDRDGVLNIAFVRHGKPYPPLRIQELVIMPGIITALRNLKSAGFILIVVTNQPDVSRGLISIKDVELINSELKKFLPVDEFKSCFHDDRDHCFCRKPLPGALMQASIEHKINLKESYMVGDRWRDIAAGRAAGCKTIFIDYGYKEERPEKPDFVLANAAEIDKLILKDAYEKY